VQQLMKTVREEEINLRKTELRALQAQINPHFLYNTLDSISWMCEQGKNAEAVEMVNALARLFRISISRGHELIPIRNELQHAESYLEIQAHRYKNQFTWSIDAEESCLDYLCHKITLQPIIENAIYHGLNGLVDDGEILVSIREDGEDILFTVTDNGSGMTQEQISAIMQKDRSDRAGIGIKNVNDRLAIYFGPAYGIQIDSEPDCGTSVLIRMPKVTEEADYEKK
jgi:two-component system sensor histidine kinase YesM